MDAKGGDARFVTTGGTVEWTPDGHGLVVERQDGLYRVAKDGGEALLLSRTVEFPYSPRFSRDGQSIYYGVITGPRQEQGVWKLSLVDGKVSRLTKLEGRRGDSGYIISTDGRYLYFTWNDDDGDIWVMDVVD